MKCCTGTDCADKCCSNSTTLESNVQEKGYTGNGCTGKCCTGNRQETLDRTCGTGLFCTENTGQGNVVQETVVQQMLDILVFTRNIGLEMLYRTYCTG